LLFSVFSGFARKFWGLRGFLGWLTGVCAMQAGLCCMQTGFWSVINAAIADRHGKVCKHGTENAGDFIHLVGVVSQEILGSHGWALTFLGKN